MSLKVSESQTLIKAVCFVFHHAIIMQRAERHGKGKNDYSMHHGGL